MRRMEHGGLDPKVVQQLMFNRILALLRSLSVDQVTVLDADRERGTVECSLAGVNFVVDVSLESGNPAVD